MESKKAAGMRKVRQRRKDKGLISFRRDVKPEHKPKINKYIDKLEIKDSAPTDQ